MDSSMELKHLLNSNLPENILHFRKFTQDESTLHMNYLLYKYLPSTDNKNITNDVQWQFLLDKHSFEKKMKLQKKKSFLSRKQRSQLNLLKLPKTGWNYESLSTVRSVWKEYMRENLNLLPAAPNCEDQDWSNFSTVLAKSELIGAEISLMQSRVPSLVGIKGTIVLESKMTFQIVTEKSKLKTIMKECSVFQFHLDKMRFTVYGKYIATRPSERSVKKIKRAMLPDI